MAEQHVKVELALTSEAARSYIKQWARTGRALEAARWRELSMLEDARALRASDALIESARAVSMPARRRAWSGLVEQQALFHRLRSRE